MAKSIATAETGGVVGEVRNEIGATDEAVKRLYPDGDRNTSEIRPSAMAHAPTDRGGDPTCWDFACHGGCARGGGAKCASTHEDITDTNIHRVALFGLARRGGLRNGRRVGPNDIDDVIRQLVDVNQRKGGNQETGPRSPGPTVLADPLGDLWGPHSGPPAFEVSTDKQMGKSVYPDEKCPCDKTDWGGNHGDFVYPFGR